jgi:hypothetical protein
VSSCALARLNFRADARCTQSALSLSPAKKFFSHAVQSYAVFNALLEMLQRLSHRVSKLHFMPPFLRLPRRPTFRLRF